MTQKANVERIEKINVLLNNYHESEDPFEQTDLAIELTQGHMVWLMEMTKSAIELENENQLLYGRLNQISDIVHTGRKVKAYD